MAYKKKTWVDRLVEYAGRRKITNVSTMQSQIVDVERAEGVVSKEGTAFSAATMNDLEQRIADGFSGVQNEVDGLNRDLGGLSFGKTAEGEWGYKPSGADTVTPFNNLKTIAKNAAIMSAKGGGNYTTSQTHSGLVIGKPYFIITAEGGGSFAPQSITGMTIINQFFHDVAGASVSPPCLTIGIATATSITINYTYHNGGVVSVVIG